MRLEIKFDCVNFVKKTKITTADHRLALEVLEAHQQAEPAMYLKLEERMCLFNSRGSRLQSKSISVSCFSI